MSEDLKVNELLPVYTVVSKSSICIPLFFTFFPNKMKFLLEKPADISMELTLRQRLVLSKQK